MAKAGFMPQKFRPWIEARKKYRLTDTQIQMARELGLNPRKFDGLVNPKQEKWKLPLPSYIEELCLKRFKIEHPEIVRSIEEMLKE